MQDHVAPPPASPLSAAITSGLVLVVRISTRTFASPKKKTRHLRASSRKARNSAYRLRVFRVEPAGQLAHGADVVAKWRTKNAHTDNFLSR
jgi:hypothetical protein